MRNYLLSNMFMISSHIYADISLSPHQDDKTTVKWDLQNPYVRNKLKIALSQIGFVTKVLRIGQCKIVVT